MSFKEVCAFQFLINKSLHINTCHHRFIFLYFLLVIFTCSVYGKEGRKCFYLTMHSTHFIYGYMASDIWLRTILIVRKETHCHHIGYSFRLTARVLLYAPSHKQDSTYHSLCYTSRGALAGTRNSSMGSPHEGSIRRPIAPWANALTTELHLAPSSWVSYTSILTFVAGREVRPPVQRRRVRGPGLRGPDEDREQQQRAAHRDGATGRQDRLLHRRALREVQVRAVLSAAQRWRRYERKEGRREGRKEGRKEGGEEGRRGGRKEGRKEGRREGRKEGRKEGGKEGGEEGRREGRKEGGKEGREGRKERWEEERKCFI